jgi:DNA-binding MarR family transcriptional regulator
MEYNIVDTIMMLNEQCCHINLNGGDDSGLTAGDLRVIVSLGAKEALSSAELAARNHLSPSRMSRIIERLVSRGLLHREEDAKDRRYSRVSLTEEGGAIRGKAADFKRRCESRIKSRLSPGEFSVIQRALGLLLFAMENDNGNDEHGAADHHQ